MKIFIDLTNKIVSIILIVKVNTHQFSNHNIHQSLKKILIIVLTKIKTFNNHVSKE